jgi:hypothetical protein
VSVAPLIQPGEWWGIGEHRFLCGDLMTSDGDAVLHEAGTVDAVYTDPPWGKGEARRFRTLSGVDGGQAAPVDWYAFSLRMAGLWSHCSGDVWVAMSPLALDPMLSAAQQQGASEIARWPAHFQGRRCDLLLLRYEDGLPPHRQLKGVEVWGEGARVLDGLPRGSTVVDWCFGLGSAPLACVNGGWRFVGSELSPKRMATTLQRVGEVVGLAPRRL